MSVILDLIGGAVGAFTAIGATAVSYAAFKHTKIQDAKQNAEEIAKEEVANAVSLSGAIKDIGWIKEQLGRKPNGGGAMEQLLNNQKNMEIKIDEFARGMTKHLEWHVDRDH